MPPPRRFSPAPLVPEGQRPLESAQRAVATALHNMALQDYVVVAFHAYMWLRVSVAPDSQNALVARSATLVLLATSLFVLLLTRGAILPASITRSVVYRLGLFCPMVGSYFTLRWLLPALEPHLLDPLLLRIDELLFGATPALWMDPLVRHGTVEWFAFFYYAYFYVLAVHLLGSLVLDHGRRLHEIMFGALIIVAIGHVAYTLVPGVGPYASYPFDHSLDVGGFWWRQVMKAVSAAGAQLDIFPSLHTAFPVFFALHSFRYRHEAPYRYTWLPATFVAVNIVGATMFLRWHYGVDVLAGLMLAAGAQRLAIASYERERERSADGDRQPVWEPLR